MLLHCRLELCSTRLRFRACVTPKHHPHTRDLCTIDDALQVEADVRQQSRSPQAPSWDFLEQYMQQPCTNVAVHLQPSKAGHYSLFGQPCDTG